MKLLTKQEQRQVFEQELEDHWKILPSGNNLIRIKTQTGIIVFYWLSIKSLWKSIDFEDVVREMTGKQLLFLLLLAPVCIFVCFPLSLFPTKIQTRCMELAVLSGGGFFIVLRVIKVKILSFFKI